MTQRYVWVRIRKEDFEKIVKEKKIPMEQDLRMILGKPIKIKNTELFRLAANSTWDLGANFQTQMLNAIQIKRRKKK